MLRACLIKKVNCSMGYIPRSSSATYPATFLRQTAKSTIAFAAEQLTFFFKQTPNLTKDKRNIF